MWPKIIFMLFIVSFFNLINREQIKKKGGNILPLFLDRFHLYFTKKKAVKIFDSHIFSLDLISIY